MSLFSSFMMGIRQVGKVDDIFTSTSSLFSKTAFREAADGSSLKFSITRTDSAFRGVGAAKNSSAGEGSFALRLKRDSTPTNNGVLTNKQVNKIFTNFTIDRTHKIPNLFDLSANATGNVSVRRLAGGPMPTNTKPHHGSRRMGGY